MSDQDPDGDGRLANIECRISAMQGRQNKDEKKKDDRGLPVGIGAIMGRVATELVAGALLELLSAGCWTTGLGHHLCFWCCCFFWAPWRAC